MAPTRDELLKLYEVAIAEYRFNVELNWDRTKYYLAFNAGVLGAGAGLFAADRTFGNAVLLAGIFIVGAATSILGAKAAETGHLYYRHAVYKKTLLEVELGLLDPIPRYPELPPATLAIASTKGMRDAEHILTKTSEYFSEPLKRDSIVWRLWLLLRLFTLLNFLALFVLFIEVYTLS